MPGAAISRPPLSVDGGRTLADRLAGVGLAVYLVTGSWGLHRVTSLEPALWWEPRTWAVLGLAVLAFRPRMTTGVGVGTPDGRLLAAELVWLAGTLLTLAWAPALELGVDGAIDLGLMSVAAIALYRLLQIGDARVLIDAFERSLLALLLLLLAAAVAGGLGSGRLATLGGGPNIFGRNMGLLCVLSLDRAMRGASQGPSATARRTAWPIIAAFAALLVALSGSRGAMFATAAALACLLALGRARLGRRLMVVAGFSILGLCVVAFTEVGASVSESFATRVLDLFFREHYVSGRDRIYALALERGFDTPLFGHGLNSFPASTPWPYAHNIVLDAWFETGAFGVALLALYFATLGRSTLRATARERSSGRWAGVDGLRAAAILILVASQFSGGRYDARGLFGFAALSMVSFSRTLLPTRPTRPR